jgi:long-subunit fatty acid transport protein
MKLSVLRTASLAAVLTGLTALPAAGQTNGYVLQCLSARTSGQGCVTRAQEATPTSLFRDPAGLVHFDRATFEVNAAPFMPGLTFQNSANALVDGTRHIYPLGSIAYVGNPIGRLAWAVGVEPVGGFGSDFELQHDLLSGPEGAMVDYESFFAAAKIGAAVATEIAPGLSIGAGLSGVYAQIRDFRMPFTMPPSIALGLSGIPQLDPALYGPLFQNFTELTAYGDSEGYAGLTWTADIGIRYQTEAGFTVAASWSPETAIDVDGGTALIDMNAQFGQMMGAMVMARAQAYSESPEQAQGAVMNQLAAAGLDLSAGMTAEYEAATTITLPMTAGLGIAIPASDRLRLAGEVEWRKWSSAERTMPFRLTNGENPNINIMLNADPTNGDFIYPFPLEWQDSWSAKVGAEWAAGSTSVLRAGFIYGENPVPENTVFIAFPAISTKAATLGLTFDVRGFPLDVSYVRAFDQELVGCDHAHQIGSEYNSSRTTMNQNTFSIGTVVRF